MPELTQFAFSHKEVVEMLIKAANLHEGKWMLSLNFNFTAANGGPTPDQTIPIAIVGVQSFGLIKATSESPPSLVLDAAVVNPVSI